jgi:hypothetical protein
MKYSCRILILLLIVSSFAVAQSLEDLDSIVLSVYDGKWFGGQSVYSKVMVLFDKSLTTVLEQSLSGDTINLIVTQIKRNGGDRFVVKHWPGPSADPMYIFYLIADSDTVYFGRFAADKVIIPGNGFVYTEHRSNEMFNVKKKFKIVDNKFVEVEQPFYEVGIKSKLTKNVTIYTDTTTIIPVADLFKGQEVHVLLNSGDYYLIKTPLGLTGWVYVKFNDDGRTIHDIFIFGD